MIDTLKKDTCYYQKAVIVIGTNDCGDINRTSASIMAERRELLNEAKKHAEKVVLSSMLPHADGAVQLKVDTVNEESLNMCRSESNVDYVCNDGCFKLSDQTQNEALFVSDKLHPSYPGSTKLLKNLGLLDVMKVSRWSPNANNRTNLYHHNRFFQTESNMISRRSTPPMDPYPRQQLPQPNPWSRMYGSHFRPEDHPSVNGFNRPPNCVWCRSLNHPASNCPSRRNRSCYRCGSTEHNARWCTI